MRRDGTDLAPRRCSDSVDSSIRVGAGSRRTDRPRPGRPAAWRRFPPASARAARAEGLRGLPGGLGRPLEYTQGLSRSAVRRGGRGDGGYGRELLLSVSRRRFWPTTPRRDTLTAPRSPGVDVPSLSRPPAPRSGATRYPLAGHGVSPGPPPRHAKQRFPTVFLFH